MTAEPNVSKNPAIHRGDPVTVDRYSGLARLNHWITAVGLILLALSGLALFHPAFFFLTVLFGGGQMARFLHPWIGVITAVSFAGLFLRFWRYNLWRGDDSRWMGRLSKVLAGDEEGVPEVGRYNAGQKVYFWVMSLCIAVLFFSGLVIWMEYFADSFTIEQRRVGVLVHSTVAILAICTWIVHVYAAIWVRGTISAMTRGNVTGGWAWRHHRKWLRDLASGKPSDSE
ncbi:formate dehydrogenase subunit gamma [Paracoccus marinaquae]|uniref:Formate dehydrogenase subunit gamma n=1 Tax=Paracoccus marinaquae TaxID=2841926 RepID=A0ABS6AFR2_9RHOB|nr:formate dehydrogenase subunit gamma [Paracoccus marinaquae]MBU3029438.1 formate dehydrogenase subunit gamma [Paracoccus marinaquae]